MKNLSKIPFILSETEERNFSAKFCWQWRETPSGAPFADEYIKEIESNKTEKVELTKEGKAKKEEWSNQESINRALSAVEMGAQKMPTGFEKIKASEFLKRSAEELRKLFIVDGKIDFRGNNSAGEVLGLADFFPKVSDEPQYVVLGTTPYAYGARRRDGKIGYGNPKYKAIFGGEEIKFFIGKVKDKKTGELRENIVSLKNQTPETEVNQYSYETLNARFKDNYKNNELKNLTLKEANTEREAFLEKQKERDYREKLARQKEAELGLNENMNFKEKMTIIAKSVGESYKLPWEVIYAQAALETKNGKHAPLNNYFGIKASKDWDGPSTGLLDTKENYGNGFETIKDRFRGYSSMFDSAIGYAKFINKYNRYKEARENYRTGGTPFMYLMGIKRAGYATDPFYVYKVNKMFKSAFGYDIPGKT